MFCAQLWLIATHLTTLTKKDKFRWNVEAMFKQLKQAITLVLGVRFGPARPDNYWAG